MKLKKNQHLSIINKKKQEKARKHPREFNRFAGIKAKMINLNEISASVKNGLDMINSLLFNNWAGGQEIFYNYILSWFAAIADPNMSRANTALVFANKGQGIGKNSIIDFMRDYVLGTGYIEELCGIGSVTGNFNGHIEGKMLIIINEMASTKESFKTDFDKIKTYITDDRVSIHKKGLQPYQVSNVGSYILFSNHDDCLSIETHDRRYCVCPMGITHINDSDYFGEFKRIVYNQDVGNAFYTWILTRDRVNLFKIPESSVKNDMIAVSMPSSLRFLKQIKEEWDAVENKEMELLACFIPFSSNIIKAADFYIYYRNWCSANGEQMTTGHKFGRQINDYIEKRRNMYGLIYEISSISI